MDCVGIVFLILKHDILLNILCEMFNNIFQILSFWPPILSLALVASGGFFHYNYNSSPLLHDALLSELLSTFMQI